METIPGNKNPHQDVLDRIKRGLVGYVSYLAACEMNSSFSEYVLYEPILRILTAQGYKAECEVKCPGFDHQGQGDKKRIDFVATAKDGQAFAIEVKWAKKGSLNVSADFEKLRNYKEHNQDAFCFLCVFGRESYLSKIKLRVAGVTKFGEPLVAKFGKTKYSCQIYVLQ